MLGIGLRWREGVFEPTHRDQTVGRRLRKCKPLTVGAKFGRLFSCVADAAQTIVDFDRMGIGLVAIADSN